MNLNINRSRRRLSSSLSRICRFFSKFGRPRHKKRPRAEKNATRPHPQISKVRLSPDRRTNSRRSTLKWERLSATKKLKSAAIINRKATSKISFRTACLKNEMNKSGSFCFNVVAQERESKDLPLKPRQQWPSPNSLPGFL